MNGKICENCLHVNHCTLTQVNEECPGVSGSQVSEVDRSTEMPKVFEIHRIPWDALEGCYF